MDNKLIPFSLSIIGIDGKPLTGVCVHLDIEKLKSADYYTDEKGTISEMAPNCGSIYITISHGLYQARYGVVVNDHFTDNNLELNFTGCKALTVSLDCPSLPVESNPCFRILDKEYVVNLKKTDNNKWEGALYVPQDELIWLLTGENIESYGESITIKEDATLTASLPAYNAVTIHLENAPDEKLMALVLCNKLSTGHYILDKKAYFWRKATHYCVFSIKTMSDFLGKPVTFKVGDNEPAIINVDYNTFAKTEKVKIQIDFPEQQSDDDDEEEEFLIQFMPEDCWLPIDVDIQYGTESEAELPIGKYDYFIGTPVVCKGSIEVKEGVENSLILDLSDAKEITFETPDDSPAMLMDDQKILAVSEPEDGIGKIYATPGNYSITTDLSNPIPVVVGDSNPEKILLPPRPDENLSFMYNVYDIDNNEIEFATVFIDDIKLRYMDMGFMCTNIPRGEHKITVTCPGFETYTETINVANESVDEEFLYEFGATLLPARE